MEYLVLIAVILIVVAVVIYELREAGHSLDDTLNGVVDSVFGPRTVTTPKALQDFLDEPANQSFTPWTPTYEPDESYPPAWLGRAK